jgi:tetratricopeptide (TPR) repeat protein
LEVSQRSEKKEQRTCEKMAAERMSRRRDDIGSLQQLVDDIYDGNDRNDNNEYFVDTTMSENQEKKKRASLTFKAGSWMKKLWKSDRAVTGSKKKGFQQLYESSSSLRRRSFISTKASMSSRDLLARRSFLLSSSRRASEPSLQTLRLSQLQPWQEEDNSDEEEEESEDDEDSYDEDDEEYSEGSEGVSSDDDEDLGDEGCWDDDNDDDDDDDDEYASDGTLSLESEDAEEDTATTPEAYTSRKDGKNDKPSTHSSSSMSYDEIGKRDFTDNTAEVDSFTESLPGSTRHDEIFQSQHCSFQIDEAIPEEPLTQQKQSQEEYSSTDINEAETAQKARSTKAVSEDEPSTPSVNHKQLSKKEVRIKALDDEEPLSSEMTVEEPQNNGSGNSKVGIQNASRSLPADSFQLQSMDHENPKRKKKKKSTPALEGSREGKGECDRRAPTSDIKSQQELEKQQDFIPEPAIDFEKDKKRQDKLSTRKRSGTDQDLKVLIDPSANVTTSLEEVSVLTEDTSYIPVIAEPQPTTSLSSGLEKMRRKSRSKRKSSSKSRRPSRHADHDGTTSSLSALLDDVVNTRNKWQGPLETTSIVTACDTFAQRVVQQLYKMLVQFVQLSDALEILIRFGGTEGDTTASDISEAHRAFECISANYAPLLSFLWTEQLQYVLKKYWTSDPQDRIVEDLLYRIALLLRALAVQFKDLFFEQCQPPMEVERNRRTKALFVTMFELLRREAWALSSREQLSANHVSESSLKFQPSVMLQLAWDVAVDSDEWRNLCHPQEVLSWEDDTRRFRRVCCEKIVHIEESSLLVCPRAVTLLLEYCELGSLDMLEATVLPLQSCESLDEDNDCYSISPVPETASLILKRIHGYPLPRKSLKDKVLSRILPGESLAAAHPLATSLVGKACVGKSVLAAMVVQLDRVRKFYADGIVWIQFHNEELNYNCYMMYLHEICRQLGYKGKADGNGQTFKLADLTHMPGESETKRCTRERMFMTRAMALMVDLLHNKKVLLVLDNVARKQDIEWFMFFEESSDQQSSVLVTTRCPLLPRSESVDVGVLKNTAEALQLLHQESCMNPLQHQNVFYESEAALSIVEKCFLHPMAAFMLGRFLCLKRHQFCQEGEVELEPIDRVVAKFNGEEVLPMMCGILNMSLSPSSNGVPTNVFNICVVAFVEVFCDRLSLSDVDKITAFPQVPIEIAEILFESVLVLDEDLLQEEASILYHYRNRAAELILRVLRILGVLIEPVGSSGTVCLAHRIYDEYVKCLLCIEDSIAILAQDKGKRWHRALAGHFLDSMKSWEENDSRLLYSLEMLPSHLIRGDMFIEAGDVLSDRGFSKARYRHLGLPSAAQRHIKDVELLLTRIVPGPRDARITSRPYYGHVIRQAYGAFVDLMAGKGESEERDVFDGQEIAEALVVMGTSFSEWLCWNDAISVWMSCLSVSSLALAKKAALLYTIGIAFLELSDYGQAVASLNECLELRRKLYGSFHILCAQTMKSLGDIFFTTGEFSNAVESYKRALQILQQNIQSDSCVFVDIGDIQEKLGVIHHKRWELDESVQAFKDALCSKKKYYGTSHLQLASVYQLLGVCLVDKQEIGAARESFEKALGLWGDSADDYERRADQLTCKGFLAKICDENEIALKCFDDALQILQSNAPRCRVKMSHLLHFLGRIYFERGQERSAMTFFEASNLEGSKILGVDHVDFASNFCYMAAIHQRAGRNASAMNFLKEALRIRELHMPDSALVSITKKYITRLSRQMRKKD